MARCSLSANGGATEGQKSSICATALGHLSAFGRRRPLGCGRALGAAVGRRAAARASCHRDATVKDAGIGLEVQRPTGLDSAACGYLSLAFLLGACPSRSFSTPGHHDRLPRRVMVARLFFALAAQVVVFISDGSEPGGWGLRDSRRARRGAPPRPDVRPGLASSRAFWTVPRGASQGCWRDASGVGIPAICGVQSGWGRPGRSRLPSVPRRLAMQGVRTQQVDTGPAKRPSYLPVSPGRPRSSLVVEDQGDACGREGDSCLVGTIHRAGQGRSVGNLR